MTRATAEDESRKKVIKVSKCQVDRTVLRASKKDHLGLHRILFRG